MILLKLLGTPLLDALKYEQELKADITIKARKNGFMKAAKLQILGKKRK